MDRADNYLGTLATVCESAQKLELHGVHGAVTESFANPTTHITEEQQTLSTSSIVYHENPPLKSIVSQQQTVPAICLHQSNFLLDTLTPIPTPPPIPSSSLSHIQNPLFSPQINLPDVHLNPLTNSSIAHTKFQQYLDETWPEDPQRRGSAVIRASIYRKIADVLHGQVAGSARFKQWVKKSEFFLIEKFYPSMGYGVCLAIPTIKMRRRIKEARTTLKAPVQAGQHSYKLVARLEDFVHIIGNYHNSQKGHHGIRKTYTMIKEDFNYIPRTAVTKFIELCDVCSRNKYRHGNKHKSSKGNISAEMSEERSMNATPNKGTQDSRDVPIILCATGSTTNLYSNKENTLLF